MTLQQLEYIVALDNHRHFVLAAESCGVTQPTLSSMIQKFENEIDVLIFDRAQHPVRPTRLGQSVIAQARLILKNCDSLVEIVDSERDGEFGEVRFAVIPTVAPYIVPRLIGDLGRSYSDLKLHIVEANTATIVRELVESKVDVALLATPLNNDDLLEIPVYYERFVGYVSPSEPLFAKTEIVSSEMPSERLWVLQEGHCLRGQVLNFCRSADFIPTYEAGSIDTLIRIVDGNGGYTIIPELHVDFLSDVQRECVRELVRPTVVREISLVIRRDYVRQRVLNILVEGLRKVIPNSMIDERLKRFTIRL